MIFFLKGGTACPLQNFFPPFRIRLLVLDRSSNAERVSGGEVEMILKDRSNPHFTETTTGSCALILALFCTGVSDERLEMPERTLSTEIVMAGRMVKFYY